MLESIVIIGFCIILIIFGIWFVKQAIYFFSNKSNEKKYLGCMCIFFIYTHILFYNFGRV
jgi:Kef-type K+ transport system membrane component KefB